MDGVNYGRGREGNLPSGTGNSVIIIIAKQTRCCGEEEAQPTWGAAGVNERCELRQGTISKSSQWDRG